MNEFISQMAPMINALPMPLMILSRDRLLSANTSAYHLFPKLKIGDLFTSLLRAPEVLACLARVNYTSQPEYIIWRERVPVERVFEIHMTPFRTGHETFMLLTFRDLTEAKRIDQMRSDFIANASHELRTPLASLLGFIDTLQGAAKHDPEAQAHFLTIMREQVMRMTRLVNDLLSLSQIEQVEHIRPEAHVNLVPILNHVIEALAPLASKHELILNPLYAETPCEVPGTQDEWVRIAENLIENAIKYGVPPPNVLREKWRIDIGLEVCAQQVCFSVKDYGPGIDAQHLPRLTERFYRVHEEGIGGTSGTGLGLAIVKHSVMRLGGYLTIESVKGQGACFTLRVPREDENL